MNEIKTSILNEEYTEKIKEITTYLRKAYDIYDALPDSMKAADNQNIKSHLANGINSTNQLAWSFGIDTKQ